MRCALSYTILDYPGARTRPPMFVHFSRELDWNNQGPRGLSAVPQILRQKLVTNLIHQIQNTERTMNQNDQYDWVEHFLSYVCNPVSMVPADRRKEWIHHYLDVRTRYNGMDLFNLLENVRVNTKNGTDAVELQKRDLNEFLIHPEVLSALYHLNTDECEAIKSVLGSPGFDCSLRKTGA